MYQDKNIGQLDPAYRVYDQPCYHSQNNKHSLSSHIDYINTECARRCSSPSYPLQ